MGEMNIEVVNYSSADVSSLSLSLLHANILLVTLGFDVVSKF